MLIYSELTGKHNNLARNRFLLSEPKIVTKIGILNRFATWPIAQTKIFCYTHTTEKCCFIVRIKFSIYKKIVHRGCQLGLRYQIGNILVFIT